MAGSWSHMTNDDGTLHDKRFALLENKCDNTEALSQCYGMIWQMAHWLAAPDAGREDLLAVIKRAQETWKPGYERGAGHTPW